MDIQSCGFEDSQEVGIMVESTGEAKVMGTTIRSCGNGLLVKGKATIGMGCSITACRESGVYAQSGEVTVEYGELQF